MAVAGWRVLRLRGDAAHAERSGIPGWVVLRQSDAPELWSHLLCALHLRDRMPVVALGGGANSASLGAPA